MIRNQWYAVLDSNEVKPGQLIGVTRMGERLVFWRDSAGRLSCLRDQCVHRGAALSAGKVRNDHIACPFHGLEYDVSGRCVVIPANGRNAPAPEQFRVAGYPTQEAHGFIYLWWGEARADLPAVPFFEDIDDAFSYGTAHDPWATHYSRAIENQLDPVHVPFVHYNTIGRGNRTVVDGPTATLTGDTLVLGIHNHVDDGSRALTAEELAARPGLFKLEFRFPNLWQNHIAEALRIVVAFVPVDETHCLLYLRYYQKFMRLPGLRGLVNALGVAGSLVVAHQDRRVVETQRPPRSELKMGEKLFPGDRPIVAYRRRRQELLDAAGQ